MAIKHIKQKIFNPNVTNGTLRGDANLYYKARIFSFADMLPVKLSISLLKRNVMTSQVKEQIKIQPQT